VLIFGLIIVNKSFPGNRASLESQRNIVKGGYVHANGYMIGRVLENAHSLDLKSAHPSQEINRLFPKERPTKSRDFIGDFNTINNSIEIGYIKYKKYYKNTTRAEYFLKKPRFTKVGYHGRIVLKNVQVKHFGESNNMPTISTAQCANVSSDVVLDNGRILKAGMLDIYIDYVSFIQYSLTYTFEVVDVVDLYTYPLERAQDYPVNAVRTYAVAKEFYKQLEITVNDTKRKLSQKAIKTIASDRARRLISEAKDWREQAKVINRFTRHEKRKLDSQYGINMQDPLKDYYKLVAQNEEDDDETIRFEKEETLFSQAANRKHMTDYLFGVYVPLWTQLELTCMTIIFYEKLPEATVCYWDTDSLKIYGETKENVKKVMEYCNDLYRQGAIDVRGECYLDLGVLTYEEEYDYFIAIGCKRYITINDDYVKATLSGLIQATSIYQEIYNQCKSFPRLVNTCFKINTRFTQSATKGLESDYRQVGKVILDKRAKRAKSGVVLVKQDWHLAKLVGDAKSQKLRKYYNDVYALLFNNPQDLELTTITRDEDGVYYVERNGVKEII
jgi:hypothetical protein